MLVIRPTEDGRLHLSNNRRSDVARDEATARSLAYRWGHTDISINKALAEMRSAGREPERGWRVGRSAAAEAPAAPTVRVAAERPVAETDASPRPRRTRAPRRAAKPAPTEEPATESAAAKVAPAPEEPAAPARPPRKRSRPRAEPTAPATGDAPVEAAAPAPAAKPLAEPPAKPKRRSRPRPAPPAEAAAEPAPSAAPEPVDLPAPAPAPRKRKPRPRPAPPAEAAAEPAAADPRREALKLFREGVRELAAVERATLPFARAPWSDLREMADYIAACLDGKKPKAGWTREEK